MAYFFEITNATRGYPASLQIEYRVMTDGTDPPTQVDSGRYFTDFLGTDATITEPDPNNPGQFLTRAMTSDERRFAIYARLQAEATAKIAVMDGADADQELVLASVVGYRFPPVG